VKNNKQNTLAFQTLISDLVENILRYSDNPGACAQYVTTQIRELIGVRLVGLVSTDNGTKHTLVGLCPHKKMAVWNQSAIQTFITSVMTHKVPRFIDPMTDFEGKSLQSIGIGTSFVVPLIIGDESVGMLILLDLMDEAGTENILNALTRVASVIALILKNSLLYKNLEQNVEERTAELRQTNAELLRSEAALIAKNTELERFTYTVSHDLKSPLITIQSYAGMISKDLADGNYARAQGDLKRIEGATAKLTEMLNDLLELSRVGRIMNPPEKINMNLLVTDVLKQLDGLFIQKQIEVILHPDLPSVTGDMKRLSAVIQNLFENAIKNMGDQVAPRIEVGIRNDGGESIFFVKDNGKGIEPCFHESIFGLFNKLDSKIEGTGIGLALVKRIIEVHGGRVWVESNGVGTGSCFCFTVPG
jgi:signal transduction histidine kinase